MSDLRSLSSLFPFSYTSGDLRSVAAGRRQKAMAEAEELGLEVYEYVYPEDRVFASSAPRFHGFALASSEAHLDGLVTVFEVMSS